MTQLEMHTDLLTKKLLAVIQNEMLDYFQQERNYIAADFDAYGLSREERASYYHVIRALEYITCMKVTSNDINHATKELEELDHFRRMEEDTADNVEIPF